MINRILIIEDSPDQAELIKIFIAKHSGRYEAQFASSGQDCLEKCRDQAFDAIVLDYKLPDLTGIEVLNLLRARKIGSPVIIITAQGDERVAVEAMKSGAADYVAKDENYLLALPKVIDSVIERSHLQLQLRQKEEFLSKIVEKADDFIFSLDCNLNISFVNPQISKLGYLEEEILGKPFFKLLSSNHEHDSVRLLLQKPGDKNYEFEFVDKKGNLRHLILSFSILSDVGDSGRSIVGIAKDVTETLNLHKLIKDSKNKLEAFFDGITDFILVFDRECRVVMANEKVASFIHTTPDKVVGMNRRELFGENLLADGDILEKTCTSRRSEFAEVTHGQRVFQVWTYPMFDTDGELEHVIEYYRDVTEQRSIERKLIQSEKLATIGLLASGVAHELRNPLNIIETARYFISDSIDESNEEIQAKLRIIQRNIRRSSNIINNLLEFSRHSTKDKEHINVNRTLDNTLSLIQKDLESQNIRVIKDYGKLLPAYLGLDSLKQVCLNIIINAIHAMPSGGELHIQTEALLNGWIQINIKDTGHGIPKDKIDEVFAPFFTTKEAGQGTGLGMYVSHSIMKREGGDISVTSEEGKGTVFNVLLPTNGSQIPKGEVL